MRAINVIMVGFGYWGPNLARNIVLNSKFNLLGIVDQDYTRRQAAESLYGVPTYTSISEISTDQTIDLAVICTRPSSHKLLATNFIKKHINVLITKPCGISSEEAEEIAKLAEEESVKVFCDFTYHYSPQINFLLSDPAASSIVKEMQSYTSYRTSLGIVQADVDVLADLAVHDLYILLLLKSKLPISGSCLKTNPEYDSQIQAAFITLKWDDGFTAAIHISWNSPKKVRHISIVGKNRGIILEENNRESPVQLIHFSPNFSNYGVLTAEEKFTRNVSFIMGKLEVPQIGSYEALAKEIEDIAHALMTSEPISTFPNARSASQIWKIVEALRESNRLGGVIQYVK